MKNINSNNKNKTARAGVEASYTNLTQPAGLATDWAGIDYTKPIISHPGGIPSGCFAFLR